MFLSCQDGHDTLDSPMEIKVETTVETETSTLDRYDMNEEPVSEPNFVIFSWSCCVAHPSMHPAEAVMLSPVPVSLCVVCVDSWMRSLPYPFLF